MHCQAYRNLVAAHLDGALDSLERLEAEAHVESCPGCADLRAQVELARRTIKQYGTKHVTPAALRARLLQALEAEAIPSASTSDRRWLRPRSSRVSLLIGVVAAVVVLIIGNPFRRSHPDSPIARNLTGILVEDVRRANAGELFLEVRSDQIDSLRAFYRQTGKFPFDDTAEDFSHLGLRPVGATVGSIRGVLTTLTVYEGPAGKVVCRRFLAGTIPLPLEGKRVGAANVLRVGEITVRIQQIGSIVCILAGSLPEEALADIPHHFVGLD